MTQQKIKKLQHVLFDCLSGIKKNHFDNCYHIENPDHKFYSPFILGLIGIFLLKTDKSSDLTEIIKVINTKLISTPNKSGIFNFFGNDNYYYDVDTTSIVNAFFVLNKSKSPNYYNYVCHALEKNFDEDENFIKTWIDRPDNNFDWFVNYNYLVYLSTLNRSNPKIENYLRSKQNGFLKNGSRYYSDISFPLFMLKFYIDELGFEINSLSINYKTNNFYYPEINKFTQRGITDDLLLLEEILDKPKKYFNSSEATFASKELNAAILLHLINKYYEQQN